MRRSSYYLIHSDSKSLRYKNVARGHVLSYFQLFLNLDIKQDMDI